MLGDTKTIQVLSALEGGLKTKQDLNQVLTQVGVSTQEIDPHQLLSRAKNRPLDPEKINALMQSIREMGVLEDLIARPHPTEIGKYELLAGSHRRESCIQLGILAPTKIVQVDDKLAAKIAGATNAHRNQLNALEEADMVLEVLALELEIPETEVESLLWQHSNKTIDPESSQWKVIETVMPTVTGVTINSFIRHYLSLRKLPQDLLDAVRSGKLHYTKAQKLIRLKQSKFDQERQALLQDAIADSLSISDLSDRVEQVVSALASDQPRKSVSPRRVMTRRVKAIYQQVGQIQQWDATSQKEIEKLLTKLEEKLHSLSNSAKD
ncbi:chromosome (plasmid) partitioning protein ParB / stage 0 sporulation protein J [Leptolyngbya sp. NIES-2104]|nr:chromosome (plasmid) partitioning protein ParB / stage 0 sporulation protein J [Leptolyngbya sp. NIES-2104]